MSFREEKIQKEEIFREGPMTEGHLSERSFLDLRGHFSNLIQMREIGTKKSFSGKPPKMLTFFLTSLVFQRSWKREVRKKLGRTKLKAFM